MKKQNNSYDELAQDWFQDRYLSIKSEAKRYFLLTLVLAGLLGSTLIAWMILLPLKSTVMEPYVILVDNVSGITSTLTAASSEEFGKNSPVIRFFLTKYVQAHDSYSLATAETQYDMVRSFSSPTVFNAFKAEWGSEELKDLMNKLGPQGALGVDVVSVTFPEKNIAHVRYIQKISREGNVLTRSTWLATLKFDHLEEVDEVIASINPLGLVVTHYQRVRESENV